jgi:hypothetical protein
MKIPIITILSLALFFCHSSARIFQTSMKMSNIGINNGWIYLDKMTFAPGTVSVNVMTITSGIPYGRDGIVTIEAIPHNLW